MHTEKRKKQRKPLERRVWIDRGDGLPPLECALGNLSDTGAKLVCKIDRELPEEFILRFMRDGKVAQMPRCVVSDSELGVTFTARLDSVAEAAEA